MIAELYSTEKICVFLTCPVQVRVGREADAISTHTRSPATRLRTDKCIITGALEEAMWIALA
jgi:hypothetical protein